MIYMYCKEWHTSYGEERLIQNDERMYLSHVFLIRETTCLLSSLCSGQHLEKI